MQPVSFVRTAPTALGEKPGGDATVCDSCGSVLRDETGKVVGGGYTNPLSLDELLVQHPHATYFLQVGTKHDEVVTENTYLGVRTGDILTIDRVRSPQVGSLVLAVCMDEMVLCRFTEHEGKRFLVCGHKGSTPREITPEQGVHIWGVVSALSRRL